jgi:hypothetical protein
MRASALILALSLFLPAAARSVDAEPTGLDEDALAKMAKARAKSHSQPAKQDSSSMLAGDEAASQKGLSSCGINIGNSVNSKPGKAPKEIIVVIRGDVINANNRCK